MAAHAWVRVPTEALAELRRKPGPGCDTPLPLNALKQADEQTVAAVSAVYHAVHHHGLNPADCRDWAVLAAPYYMGRPSMVVALNRYKSEGAWGASPHLPPHRSLHSPSGTISQLFKIHGPNFGVCGGPGCAPEVLAAAAAMLDARRVPGVWAVLTALDPDLPPDRQGVLPPGTHCAALALALTPAAHAGAAGNGHTNGCTSAACAARGARVRLRVVGGAAPAPPPATGSGPSLDLFTLNNVLDALGHETEIRRAAFVLPLEAGGRVEIERVGRAAAHARRNGHHTALDARLLSPRPLAEAKR